MNARSRFDAFDAFDVPLCVFDAEAVLYVNPACRRLLQSSSVTLPEGSVRDLIPRFVHAEDHTLVQSAFDAITRGAEASELVWVRLLAHDGTPRQVCVRRFRGIERAEWLCLLVETPEEGSVQALTCSLVVAAGELMRCREEDDVLETSVEVLHRNGFFSTVLLLDGDALVHGPMRQDPEALAAAERRYGRPLPEVRFPRASVPHLDRMFETRRGMFHQDFLRILEPLHQPEVFQDFQRRFPGERSADAPLFAGGQPLGCLSIQGLALTPACAGAVELFAQLMNSAIDNVRHHKEAEQRMRELRTLQQELVDRERLAALGEAAAVVSHEVRNPLGAILNAVALLRRDPAVDASHGQVMSVIEEEALRLDQMVADLLAFARPLEPRPGRVETEVLVKQTIDHLRGQLPTADIAIDWSARPLPAPVLVADAALLQLALGNLLRNAVQASPPGGRVDVRIEAGGDAVHLVVEDQGEGVAEELFGRVFEPFFTTRAMGSGLGLAVVKRVAQAHGGSVSVGRGERGGAAFRLSLPRAP